MHVIKDCVHANQTDFKLTDFFLLNTITIGRPKEEQRATSEAVP